MEVSKRSEGDGETLSRRERQIMDVIVRREQATARDVCEELPDPPSYSSVRKLLAVLEEKGHVRHKTAGKSYVYSATGSRTRMAASALRRLRDTFFEGSVAQVVNGLVRLDDTKLSESDLAEIAAIVEEAKRKEGKKP